MQGARDFETGKKELYNLKDDIAEQHNLSDELPEIREQSYSMLKECRENINASMLSPNPDWDGKVPCIISPQI